MGVMEGAEASVSLSSGGRCSTSGGSGTGGESCSHGWQGELQKGLESPLAPEPKGLGHACWRSAQPRCLGAGEIRV